MQQIKERRRERVQLRLDSRTKRKLERAAAFEQKSVTEFVVECASVAADRVIERHQRITLAPADWDAFYEALVSPPEPTDKLREAVRWYRSLTR